MIRILYVDEHGMLVDDVQLDDLAGALENPNGVLWLDFAGETVARVESILAEMFKFHPLAVDDAVRESHVPKVDDWQDYLYVVLRPANHTTRISEQLEVPELDIFLGPNYLVTYAQETIAALDRVLDFCQKDRRWTARGAGHLLYRLADELVSEAVAVVNEMQEELEQIEEQLFAEAGPATLARLFMLKRNILQLRRTVIPQREVLSKLARNDYAIVRTDDRVFFRDVYDHLLHLDDLLDDMLILVGGALEIYLSVVNNRMNDVMKTLTVITALFMPLAFITGFFGMNFFQAAGAEVAWTGQAVLAAVLVIMVLIPLAMFLWMRRRSWI